MIATPTRRTPCRNINWIANPRINPARHQRSRFRSNRERPSQRVTCCNHPRQTNHTDRQSDPLRRSSRAQNGTENRPQRQGARHQRKPNTPNCPRDPSFPLRVRSARRAYSRTPLPNRMNKIRIRWLDAGSAHLKRDLPAMIRRMHQHVRQHILDPVRPCFTLAVSIFNRLIETSPGQACRSNSAKPTPFHLPAPRTLPPSNSATPACSAVPAKCVAATTSPPKECARFVRRCSAECSRSKPPHQKRPRVSTSPSSTRDSPSDRKQTCVENLLY